jgi:hypothetical protein
VPDKITTGTKYLEIVVPNYDATEQRDAYLRIGNSDAFADPSVHGASLWEKFEKFLDQSPEDHLRDRTGATPARGPLYGAADTKENFIANMGWRDHTDGNRLTTTGGDKVEVIRGNYQLIVLGRGSGDVDDGSVFDASGGHIVSGDIAPGNVTKIEYKSAKFGGTWKVTEEVEKGHVHEIFQGEFKEEFRGSKKTSIVGTVPGSLTSAFTAEGSGAFTGNPEILEGTWASTITEHVGSSDSRITSITSNTYAGTITETTDATGTISETKKATSITETINATSITSTIMAKTMTETIGTAGDHCYSASTYFGARKETTMGAKLDILLGGLVEVFVGGKFGLVLAKEVEIILGAHMEIHAGSFREITLGYKWDLVVGQELEVETYSTKITAISNKSIAAAIFLG